MADFAAYLIRSEHIALMLAVAGAIHGAQALLPGLRENPHWVRLLPVLPMAACSLAVWLPGFDQGSVATRLLLGLVLGSFCGHAHKVVRQTVFGNDKRIRDHPTRL